MFITLLYINLTEIVFNQWEFSLNYLYLELTGLLLERVHEMINLMEINLLNIRKVKWP